VPLALSAALAPALARAQDEEPPPRAVFFLEPDAQTQREIDDLVNNWFKDLNKVVTARDRIVRRYRLVAVPSLVRVLEANANEPEVWASTLALAALRRAEGPHPALFPAIPALLRLLREAPEWRRAFAALALGQFYGVAGIGHDLDPPSAGEDGPRARARRASADAVAALGEALSHPHPQVRLCAALALAKIGGLPAWNLVSERARGPIDAADATVEGRASLLLALALLPGPDEGRLEAVLDHEDAPLRAAGALGLGLQAAKAWGRQGAPPSRERIAALDRALVNSKMTLAGVDGAEATWARGALALHDDPASRTWDALHEIASSLSTDRDTAVAAAQALLFAPEQHPVRGRIAVFVSRENAGSALREPVLAAFLVVAGSDGTPTGVRACAHYLRRRERNPRARPDYDVRYHAAVGLLRGFHRGRISGEDRTVAVDALAEAVSRGLVVRDEGSFHDVLSRVLTDSLRGALATDPRATVPTGDLLRVEAAFRDPDALLARDPLDVAAHRLNLAVRRILGLENLKKPVVRDGGGRETVKDLQPLRYLDGWVSGEPYLLRRDLRDDRGFPPPPRPFEPAEAAIRIER
jgi:hypothetical protein